MIPAMLQAAWLRQEYVGQRLSPLAVAEEVLARVAAGRDPAVWISRTPPEALRARARALAADPASAARLPLYGVPFAVKDNIDVAGYETTAACPAYAYRPAASAAVVRRLLDAGAMLVGKTNLDQFATGLVGTRSPYGAPRSVFNDAYVSGGSSSGSAVAVAAGLVSFALGTDTAGSGRVPAAFNNLVGLKPTRGWLSTAGVVPACRTLDCVSVFAATAGDAWQVVQAVRGFDAADPFSRPAKDVDLPDPAFRFGVLAAADREFAGDADAEALYDAAVSRLQELGGSPVPFDYAPFRETARLLYGGPFVAERLAAIRGFHVAHAAAMDPTVRAIIGGAASFSAVDLLEGQYRLQELRRRTEAVWEALDLLLLPTAPTIVTVDEVSADPVGRNSLLGTYTNFVNLLDLAALAVPAGFRRDALPFGVTLVAPAHTDRALARLGDRLHRALGIPVGGGRERPHPASMLASPGAPPNRLPIVVAGAHLSGMALNHELTGLGARLLRRTHTDEGYALYALAGTVPPKPGLVRRPGGQGGGIEVEVWELDVAAFGRFVAGIPAPLGIGKVALADGAEIPGFICEPSALQGATDITHFGGWRAYVASLQAPSASMSPGLKGG